MQQSLHRQWGSVVWFCGLFFRKERVSELVCRQLYRNFFLATFDNALCKDVAPIGVFGGVCLQAAARDFQCASVRLGKGLIFDKRRSCRQKQKFFQKIQKCNCTKKTKRGATDASLSFDCLRLWVAVVIFYFKNANNTPAATAEPITPATFGPIACINKWLLLSYSNPTV